MTTDFLALATSEGRTLLGQLADGTQVFTKKGPNHLLNHPEVMALLPEILAMVSAADFDGQNLNKVLDLRRPVGVSTCVETTDADRIVYARRKGRKADECSRFVMNRAGTPCNTVVLRLYLNDQGLTALMTAFIGTDSPPEPCTPSGRKDMATWEAACSFWQSHALCWDGDVEPGDLREADFYGGAPWS